MNKDKEASINCVNRLGRGKYFFSKSKKSVEILLYTIFFVTLYRLELDQCPTNVKRLCGWIHTKPTKGYACLVNTDTRALKVARPCESGNRHRQLTQLTYSTFQSALSAYVDYPPVLFNSSANVRTIESCQL